MRAERLNRGSEYFDIGREKASPAATAEENSLRTRNEKVNTHRQSGLFKLQMVNQIGERKGGKRNQTSAAELTQDDARLTEKL